MKIRAGFIIDYDDISMKEAGEIEETIQSQMELIAAVYQKGQYLDKRKTVLNAWANYINSPK